VAENLGSLPVPESKLPGYVFDPSVWRGNLADKSTMLDQLVAKVATEQREAEASMMAKRESIDKYDDAFSCIPTSSAPCCKSPESASSPPGSAPRRAARGKPRKSSKRPSRRRGK
jgi:hypothetical protein